MNQVIWRASCKGYAFRYKNQEIMNQEEDGQPCFYAVVLRPVGK